MHHDSYNIDKDFYHFYFTRLSPTIGVLQNWSIFAGDYISSHTTFYYLLIIPLRPFFQNCVQFIYRSCAYSISMQNSTCDYSLVVAKGQTLCSSCKTFTITQLFLLTISHICSSVMKS